MNILINKFEKTAKCKIEKEMENFVASNTKMVIGGNLVMKFINQLSYFAWRSY
jgi:hypothetical protein